MKIYLYLYPLDLDPPGPGGLVQDVLHQVADHLPLRQDLSQGLNNIYSVVQSDRNSSKTDIIMRLKLINRTFRQVLSNTNTDD